MNIHSLHKQTEFPLMHKKWYCLGNIADVETDEELNVAEEKDAWKARVVVRIKRDREDLDAIVKEKEDVKRDDSYEIISRDYSAQTGEDKMILPKDMQVKHFVCTGRTKWTRLLVHK
ncbi:microfibrillar-associated protein 1-like protein [Tanacetum coccineum]